MFRGQSWQSAGASGEALPGGRKLQHSLRVDSSKGKDAAELHKMLCTWRQATAMLQAGEISWEDYDRWRYYYPEFDNTQTWVKTPPKDLSNALVKQLSNRLKDR